MLPLIPRPLPSDLLLAAVVACTPADLLLGVWLRARRQSVARQSVARQSIPRQSAPLIVQHGGQRRLLLIDDDLGRLLRRCSLVAVGLGSEIALVPAEELLRARALRIEVSLRQRSAEEVLAACATARAPILRSRVVYGALPDRRANG